LEANFDDADIEQMADAAFFEPERYMVPSTNQPGWLEKAYPVVDSTLMNFRFMLKNVSGDYHIQYAFDTDNFFKDFSVATKSPLQRKEFFEMLKHTLLTVIPAWLEGLDHDKMTYGAFMKKVANRLLSIRMASRQAGQRVILIEPE
jgi:hypothetical protein